MYSYFWGKLDAIERSSLEPSTAAGFLGKLTSYPAMLRTASAVSELSMEASESTTSLARKLGSALSTNAFVVVSLAFIDR